MKKAAIFILLAAVLALGACGGGTKDIRPEGAYDSEKFLIEADKLVADKDYEQARKLLLEVRNRDSQKRYGAIAQLKIADAFSKEGDPDLAIAEYRRFIDLYPENQYASYAQYQVAMMYYGQIESADRGAGTAKEALREFLKLKQLYPRNPYRDVVELRIEKTINIIADGEFMIGEFYFRKEAYASAIDRFEALLKSYPAYKREDETLLLLGKAYRELKMQDKSLQAFKRLIGKYPESSAAAAAKKFVP